MFEIDLKYRIDLSNFTEQEFPYQCPLCQKELIVLNMIGFGNYPKGGFRSMMKPNNVIGAGFECPNCFTKSCFHSDESTYKMFIDYQK